MLTYDIVQIVDHDRRASYQPGRHWMNCSDDPAEARRMAARYNECRHEPDGGYRYVVEEHHVDCPHRAPHTHAGRLDQPKTCDCGGTQL